jgi:hypothetical protein
MNPAPPVTSSRAMPVRLLFASCEIEVDQYR